MPSNGGSRQLCVSCMRPIDQSIGGGEICPHCGYNNHTPQIEGALPYRTFLKKRYITGRVRAMNHEGITYTALDTTTGRRVNIREFFPHPYSNRDGSRVVPVSGSEDTYRNLQREFESLALKLSRLSTSTIIFKIIDVFREGGTTYRISEYTETVSLERYIQSKGTLSWSDTSELFIPLLSSLSRIENSGLMHLGISPKNLRVTRENKLMLDDFCISSARKTGTMIMPDLCDGASAPEQYSRLLSCGEVTDIYSTAACMIYALTGELPLSAAKRMRNPRLMLPRSIISSLPDNVIKALANALQVEEEKRTGSFERFRAELSGRIIQKSAISEGSALRDLPSTKQYTPQVRKGLPAKFWLIFTFIFSIAIFFSAGYYLINYTDFNLRVMGFIDKVQEDNKSNVVETVIVPNMVGDKYGDWVSTVKTDAGTYRFYLEEASEEFSDDYDSGIIISTEPAAGQRIEINGAVKVTVSRGTRYKTLPKIGGKKFTEVLALLEDMGFEVEKVETYSDDALSGIVLWYVDYLTGESVEYGTNIKVYVSIGPNPDAEYYEDENADLFDDDDY